jgi:hypothetical protein
LLILNSLQRPRGSDRAEQAILLIRHGGILMYLFIIRFLARCALTGARRCSSANLKRRAAFTSLVDSDPGHLEARASRLRQHNKLLRNSTSKLILGASRLRFKAKTNYLSCIVTSGHGLNFMTRPSETDFQNESEMHINHCVLEKSSLNPPALRFAK